MRRTSIGHTQLPTQQVFPAESECFPSYFNFQRAIRILTHQFLFTFLLRRVEIRISSCGFFFFFFPSLRVTRFIRKISKSRVSYLTRKSRHSKIIGASRRRRVSVINVALLVRKSGTGWRMRYRSQHLNGQCSSRLRDTVSERYVSSRCLAFASVLRLQILVVVASALPLSPR